MRARGWLAVALLAACTRRHDPPTIAKDPTPLDAIAEVAPPPKPAEITVTAAVICMTGVCAVNVETRNDGDVAISLDDQLIAEQIGDGGLARVHEQYVTIGACDAELSKYGPHPGRACKSLGPHETLKADPWRGMSCSSQCVWTCRANAMHPKGSYHFVVRECGESTRVYVSNSIEWPGP